MFMILMVSTGPLRSSGMVKSESEICALSLITKEVGALFQQIQMLLDDLFHFRTLRGICFNCDLPKLVTGNVQFFVV